MKCGFVNHNGHTLVDIQQAAEERKIQITDVIDKAKAQVAVVERKMNRQIEVMKKTAHEMLTTGNKITAIVDELVRTLREHEAAMKTKLGQINEAQQRGHATQLENFQLVVSQLNGFVECGEGILQRNIASEILQAELIVTSRFEELLSPSETKIYRPRHVSYVPNEDTKQIVNVLKVAGPGQVITSFTDPSRSVAERKGPETVMIKSGKKTNFTVLTRDSSGDPCYNEEDQVTVRIRSPTGEIEDNRVTDFKDGSYNVCYEPQCVGQHDIFVDLNGMPLNSRPWRIQVIPQNYKQISTEFRGHGKFRFPSSIARSEKSGNVAVADYDLQKVLLFDSGLKYLRTVVDLTPTRKPRSLAFTKLYNIIVVDEASHKSSRISVFTENGKLIKYISDHLINPCSVSVRSDGNILVCDSGDVSVKVLSPDGTELLRSFRVRNYDAFPFFAVFHQGRYFVSYRMAYCVKVFSEEGGPLYDIEQFDRPAGLAIDKFNQLIVCDSVVATNHSRVRFFTLDGKLVSWLLHGLDSRFCSVAVTQNGNILVSDVKKGSIQVFQATKA